MARRARAPELVAPAYRWVPEHVSSAAAEVADLSASAGFVLDAEQRLMLETVLAERTGGAWAAREGAVVAARQNLKTGGFKAIALGAMYLFADPLTVWTAHLFKTAQEAFRDIESLIVNSDHLRRRVKAVSRANGEEGIELLNGVRLNFLARSRSGGRGMTAPRLFLDEAFALSPAEMGSLLPTMSAIPNAQVLYGSSAGRLDSAVLRGIRDRGRRGGDPSLAYIEWCAPPGGCALGDDCDHRLGVEGCALDDEEKWRRANPALGRRITIEAIRAERRALPPMEFARERLGWWEDPVGGDTGIDLEVWLELRDPESQALDPVVFAVELNMERSRAVIAAAGAREDGRAHVEVVDARAGSAWVLPRALDLQESHAPVGWVLDPGAPVGSLIRDFEDAGLNVLQPTTREVAQACGAFYDDVRPDGLAHLGQDELNLAVELAQKRPLGESWAWSRKGEGATLMAVTLARWGWAHEFAAEPSIFFFSDLDDDEDEPDDGGGE